MRQVESIIGALTKRYHGAGNGILAETRMDRERAAESAATRVAEVVAAKKAIVFDLYHTLTSVESSWGGGLPSTSELLGVDRKDWNDQLLVHSRDRLVGAKTDPFAIIAEMAWALDPAIPEERIRAATANRMARMTAAITNIPSETVIVLETLKARGKLLGLITNADVMEIVGWERNAIHHLFDSTVFSCRVGMAKPEPEIYALSLRELGVAAAEAAFVGDGGSDELQAARDAGITPIMIAGVIRELWPDQIEARRQQADFVVERLDELV
jgi:putative hydrolase of the HAD superfamily